jgi:ubiquinone/menaquinone biosynthesis C-methylase UbiE
MTNSKGYVDSEYLQIAGEFLNQLKQRTYTCMQIETGNKVLDVGCGPGIDTIELSQLVGATGEVYGVDYDKAMVTEAEQRAKKAGVSAWVKYKQSEATSLPFETGYFDSCRSERLFQHLPNPAKALGEIARVTKVNGWVVVLDTDWGSGGIDTSEIDIERRLTRFKADHTLHNGYSGRQLYRLFKKQGFENVSFEVFPLVVTNYAFARQIWTMDELEREALSKKIVTEAELNKLKMELEQADMEGVFFGYGCMTLVAGQKAG